MQQNSKRVLEARGVHLTLGAHKARHALRQPQEVHSLVQQVGAQIVDGAAARDYLVLPLGDGGGGLHGTVPVEVRFVFDDAAERAVFDELVEGLEVGVPAAVLFFESAFFFFFFFSFSAISKRNVK